MNDLLKKIYEDVLMYENDVVQTNRKADEEINRLIEPYREHLSKSERDSLNELLSTTILIAEHAGFENGVRFAIEFLSALKRY